MILPALCRACTRRDSPTSGSCTAFPAGIPAGILLYGDDHHNPVDGDHGLTFDQADGDAARDAVAAWTRFAAAALT